MQRGSHDSIVKLSTGARECGGDGEGLDAGEVVVCCRFVVLHEGRVLGTMCGVACLFIFFIYGRE